MTIRRIIAAGVIAAAGGLGCSTTWAAPPTATVQDVAKFSFLRGSKWYVPRQTLPAIEMKLRSGAVRAIVDQTVWDITDYRDGYFWGRTAAVFTYAGSGQPAGDPACSRMVGSVTPSGRIHITFIPEGQNTMLGAVRGTGTLTGNNSEGWTFEMQMSTGTTSVIAHWSYMEQCKPGQPCENRLPGSNLSLANFLKQCDGT
jgi:hypothetical protein